MFPNKHQRFICFAIWWMTYETGLIIWAEYWEKLQLKCHSYMVQPSDFLNSSKVDANVKFDYKESVLRRLHACWWWMLEAKCVVTCWQQLWNFDDGFSRFRHQHPLSFHRRLGYQHPKDITNIEMPSPALNNCH